MIIVMQDLLEWRLVTFVFCQVSCNRCDIFFHFFELFDGGSVINVAYLV